MKITEVQRTQFSLVSQFPTEINFYSYHQLTQFLLDNLQLAYTALSHASNVHDIEQLQDFQLGYTAQTRISGAEHFTTVTIHNDGIPQKAIPLA